jgi:hypothetical protein
MLIDQWSVRYRGINFNGYRVVTGSLFIAGTLVPQALLYSYSGWRPDLDKDFFLNGGNLEDVAKYLGISVPDPWHFDTDPDPWIFTLDNGSDNFSFSSVAFKKPKNTLFLKVFLLITRYYLL